MEIIQPVADVFASAMEIGLLIFTAMTFVVSVSHVVAGLEQS